MLLFFDKFIGFRPWIQLICISEDQRHWKLRDQQVKGDQTYSQVGNYDRLRLSFRYELQQGMEEIRR